MGALSKRIQSGNQWYFQRVDVIYKLKRLFVERFRADFVAGKYLQHSLGKPYGYAGDFEIIDMIYQNDPVSIGFDRLYDNYFQMSTICVAVRNRKEDFKRLIAEAIRDAKSQKYYLLDLASGPCRDLHEVYAGHEFQGTEGEVHCYDADQHAIDYAKKLNSRYPQLHYFRENAVRMALIKDIEAKIPQKYDLIYSTGLFDYLDYRVAVRLVSNLKKLLKKGGTLAISDVRDKFSNPSIYFMEWVADWELIYRDDDNFRRIFLDAGFDKSQLTFAYEQQGVMQYIIARA